MALSYSNTVNKQSPLAPNANPLSTFSPSAIQNLRARGVVGNTSFTPLSIGDKGKATGGIVTSGTNPLGTAAPAAGTLGSNAGAAVASPSNIGSYKGVAITPGNDVPQQVAKIDQQGQPLASAQAGTGLSTAGQTAGTGAGITPPTNGSGTGTTYSGLVGSLVDNAKAGSPNQSSTFNNAQQLNELLARSRLSQANTDAGIDSKSIGQTFATGAKQIADTKYLAEQNALTGQLQGNAALYGAATTAQGQQLGALGTAAGFAAPQLGSIGQVPFNPLDQNQGSVLGSTQPGGLNAAGQLLGQFSGAQAVGAAPGQAAASNINTSGTVGTQTAATGYAGAVQTYVGANTSFDQAKNQSANLQASLQGINGFDSQHANTTINNLKNEFGSTKYTTFITALNEAKQSYTNLLASVGAATPTVNGQQATDIFNAASTPNQINAAIEALNQAAYAKLVPLYQQISTYQSQLGTGGASGGTPSPTTTGGTGGAGAAGGNKFDY